MEGRKKKSLVTELFGEKDSPTAGSSSSGIFGSIFGAPPNKVYGGREYPYEAEKNTGNPAWKQKDGNVVGGEGQSKVGSTSRDFNSYFQDEKVQPFYYSSSIFYGGQDVYNPPPEAAKTPVFSTFNKDGGEDDSAGASRGNCDVSTIFVIANFLMGLCVRILISMQFFGISEYWHLLSGLKLWCRLEGLILFI
ncbi:Encodes a protein involved in salt tolerance-names SIS (Salt Induced Serine rich) [Striga hermonthica]|uniref:Encodes a protein involved in salt tolerance-names SIS (Salt Induced Serine rich) n=1 Tax=Striga hermonthica TaxID=68872 RepID=A0A9N7NPJ0_STRHE|nr:Encodes a protein involved in salt tolerance-names SIS (Salt Induced Serine rich) [Striga hermonthica]